MSRTAVWELVPWPCSTMLTMRSVLSHPGIFTKARATPANVTMATTAMPGDLVLSRIEIASTGPNSPIAPAPMK